MRHKKQTIILSRKVGQRKALLKTMTISLITNGQIQTTPAKARYVRSFVERLVTRGKEKNVHTIRYVEKKLGNKDAARVVVEKWGPQFAERKGGYTRMVKVANRKGDAAEQVILEFV